MDRLLKCQWIGQEYINILAALAIYQGYAESYVFLCLEKPGESCNNCRKWLKGYLEGNSKPVVNSIFLKNKQSILIHERKRRWKVIQANLKQRPVPKKLKGMTGCTFELKTTTCTCKNNVGRVSAGGLTGRWAQLHAGAQHPARPSAPPLQPWDMDAHVHRAQQSISKMSPSATEATKESLNNGRTGEMSCSNELNAHLINWKWNHVSHDNERLRIRNGESCKAEESHGEGKAYPTAKDIFSTSWHYLMDITLLTDCRCTPREQVQTMSSYICYNSKTFPMIFVLIFEQVNMPLSLQEGKS